MNDLSVYSFGKVGNGNAIHIIFDGKSLCNSREGAEDHTLTAKDVTCKRCISPMHRYKPYKHLIAAAQKSAE